MMKIFSLILCLTLTSCSTLEYKTNAGPFLRAEVSAHVVEQYTLQEIKFYEGDFLANVTSSQCIHPVERTEKQSDSFRSNDSFSESHLIRELQVNTQSQGGNGLVVHSCNIATTADCFKHMQCNGSAYWIERGK
ncbi:hypothetical protein RI845_03795 [Thalassotalea nanhaiensis]|uniref:RcsF protein n=1 Tax=Thalassotalea nanhaiensis TaxID=3065648 RepID=A0ABY9TKG0_9GAMM|nr:hypothetical protein RI845_03795 [Colwelliaceae bacterium SQ345]